MWARITETLLALWMAVSPFVLSSSPSRADLSSALPYAFAIAVPALLSFHPRTRRAHLLGLLVASGLVLSGWIATRSSPSAAAQNRILVGLVLGMLAIVPSQASRPPRAWLEHEGRTAD
jgi:hypothetical protein